MRLSSRQKSLFMSVGNQSINSNSMNPTGQIPLWDLKAENLARDIQNSAVFRPGQLSCTLSDRKVFRLWRRDREIVRLTYSRGELIQ